MSRSLLTSSTRAVLAGALALGLGTVSASGTAPLAPAAARPSTAGLASVTDAQAPAPNASSAAPVRAYVVNVGTGGPIAAGRLRSVHAAVTHAGGQVVQSWPAVGVVVVRSARTDFLTRLRPSAATRITSVGPTRTVPVKTALRRGTGSTLSAAGLDASLTTSATAPASPAAPKDRLEVQQWGLRAIGGPTAAGAGAGVTVAVVDSGIQPDHPDLRGRIDMERSVDCTDGGRPDAGGRRWANTTSGHGTHVAGIIAAARNGIGIAGVAPAARVASVKVVDDDGFIYPEYAICGIIRTADSGLRLANHSYYIDPWRFWCASDRSQAPARESIRRAFAYAQRRGVLSVAAAGNDSTDLAHKTTDAMSPNDGRPVTRKLDRSCLDLPAELPGVVTVSAAERTGAMAAYSNYGRGVVDVMAPGTDILSTYPDNQWALLSGTSMASPHVAGVAAILSAKHPGARPEALLTMLRAQARDVPCPRGATACTGTPKDNAYAGDGMVDARRAR